MHLHTNKHKLTFVVMCFGSINVNKHNTKGILNNCWTCLVSIFDIQYKVGFDS